MTPLLAAALKEAEELLRILDEDPSVAYESPDWPVRVLSTLTKAVRKEVAWSNASAGVGDSESAGP